MHCHDFDRSGRGGCHSGRRVMMNMMVGQAKLIEALRPDPRHQTEVFVRKENRQQASDTLGVKSQVLTYHRSLLHGGSRSPRSVFPTETLSKLATVASSGMIYPNVDACRHVFGHIRLLHSDRYAQASQVALFW